MWIDLTMLSVKGNLSLRITDKILLGVLHWYFPAELRCLFNLWLEQHWGLEFKEVKDILLTSKKTSLGYLLVQDRWNNSDFYGNVLVTRRPTKNQSPYSIVSMFTFKKQSKNIRKTRRKRGYDDKGFLSPPHSAEKRFFGRKLPITPVELLQEESLQAQKFESLLNKIQLRLESS
jgi:hypothetical protein